LGFDDFLGELQSNDTLRVVKCATHIKLGISVDNWARLVVAIGGIRRLSDLHLVLYCKQGNDPVDNYQIVANAVAGFFTLRTEALYNWRYNIQGGRR
jgi:hypothetical protein